VHFEAVKQNLKGISPDEKPDLKAHWRRGWYMFAPMIVIIGMLIMGFTVMRAALFAIVSCLIIWIIEMIRRPEGFKLFEYVKKFIIGLGVPTTAKYIIMATIAAPALMMLEVPAIAAHMFVFYYAVIADMTPPVALTSYATAGIAKSDPMKTSVAGFKIGFSAYIIPFIFVYHPSLLFVNAGGLSTALFAVVLIKAIIIAILSLVCMSSLYTGYFRTKCYWWERIVLVVAAICLIYPGYVLVPPTFFIGVGIMVLIFVIQTLRVKKQKAKETPEDSEAKETSE
jgi:TRAP-type uncharacterized transport system fused permease subunit